MGRTSSKKAPTRPRSERLEARISSDQNAIAELEVIRLTASDSRAFAEALLHPREPLPELGTAAERYRKMVGGGSDRDRKPAVSDRPT